MAWRADGSRLSADEREALARQVGTLTVGVSGPLLIRYERDPHADGVDWWAVQGFGTASGRGA